MTKCYRNRSKPIVAPLTEKIMPTVSSKSRITEFYAGYITRLGHLQDALLLLIRLYWGSTFARGKADAVNIPARINVTERDHAPCLSRKKHGIRRGGCSKS